MRNYRVITVFLVFLISVSLAFSVGCAKKGTVAVDEKPAVAEQKPVAPPPPKAEVKEKQQLAQADRAAIKEAAEGVSPIAGFDYIYYDYDKYTVKPEYRGTLNKLADWLKAKP